jgi:hypothetical protein
MEPQALVDVQELHHEAIINMTSRRTPTRSREICLQPGFVPTELIEDHPQLVGLDKNEWCTMVCLLLASGRTDTFNGDFFNCAEQSTVHNLIRPLKI